MAYPPPTYKNTTVDFTGKGGPKVTSLEEDYNHFNLDRRVADLEATELGLSITGFRISGDQYWWQLSDNSELGPYDFPSQAWHGRGEWATDTNYAVDDVVAYAGSLYLVKEAHLSETPFDAGRVVNGVPCYELLMTQPANVLPVGGTTGQALVKASEDDFDVEWYTLIENLSGLLDVSIPTSGPQDGDILQWDDDAQAWVAQQPAQPDTVIGKHMIWVPASQMVPNTTNGPAVGSVELTSNKVMIRTLDFDKDTEESAQFCIALPKSWDGAQQIEYRAYWSHPSTTTNFVVLWGMAGHSLYAGDAMDANFATLGDVNTAGGTTDDLYISGTGTLPINMGSGSAPIIYPQMINFKIARRATNGSDNLAVDARLHGVMLIYVANAAVDD